MKKLFVLGAADPEMTVIENLVTEAGHEVFYAALGGSRVHPGTAYKADGLLFPSGEEVQQAAITAWVTGGQVEVVMVECGGISSAFPTHPFWWVDGHLVPVHLVDHHRPGDPGFGQAPAMFLRGSSLGQVISLLGEDEEAPPEWRRADWTTQEAMGTIQFFNPPSSGWWVALDQGDRDGWQWWVAIPQQLVLAAAADHCLAAAYRGECPGVTPDEMRQHRLEQRAAFQGRPLADVEADWASAVQTITSCPRIEILGHEVADLRDLPGGTCNEAVEGSLIARTPVLARVIERGGRQKVVLMGDTTPALVRAFLSQVETLGLVDPYGDPQRGYAGAYVPAVRPCNCGFVGGCCAPHDHTEWCG